VGLAGAVVIGSGNLLLANNSTGGTTQLLMTSASGYA
jgi:hypothetical protein